MEFKNTHVGQFGAENKKLAIHLIILKNSRHSKTIYNHQSRGAKKNYDFSHSYTSFTRMNSLLTLIIISLSLWTTPYISWKTKITTVQFLTFKTRWTLKNLSKEWHLKHSRLKTVAKSFNHNNMSNIHQITLNQRYSTCSPSMAFMWLKQNSLNW